ncbi:MAG: hypothetical protein GYA55_14200 [SAR324 cluster bacterium]|uniref:tryptophan synthase n=1 Tax=SAR324 cluster bacterium TaxID=2024889 RepID=A0A7X9FU88_9DELT|nr:hypothetical protein [SAR324 cluster bacterium]
MTTTFLEKKLKETIEKKEGILSISLAPNGIRDYEEVLNSVQYLTEAGMNQLLMLSYIPDAMKLAEIAPSERKLLLQGIEKGSYRELFFDNAMAVKKRFSDLPIVATPMLGDVLCYGLERFIKKAARVGVNGWDSAHYQAIADPVGYRKLVEKENIAFICAINAGGVDINNSDHRNTLEEIIRVTTGEVFFVPAIPGTSNVLKGQPVKSMVDFVHELQDKYNNHCPIISIGGINTPEDAYEVVRVAGTDGVHFSSAYMKRRFRGQSKEEIQAWLKEVKQAMKS